MLPGKKIISYHINLDFWKFEKLLIKLTMGCIASKNQINCIDNRLFVSVDALLLSQQFFSHVGRFSWVEPGLSC